MHMPIIRYFALADTQIYAGNTVGKKAAFFCVLSTKQN
jgi:hypothetical protein